MGKLKSHPKRATKLQRTRENVRACRTRQKKGLAQHTVEVDATVYELAIRTGYITESEAMDKRLMDKALSLMLMDAAKGTN